MWEPIVSVPDHCLSFYFTYSYIIMISSSGVDSVKMNSPRQTKYNWWLYLKEPYFTITKMH